jgi:hypothetical protein
VERATVLIVALAAVPVLSGCASNERQAATTKLARAEPKPRGQLLFAVPEMGRISGSCKSLSRFRVTVTAATDVGEDYVVSVRGAVVRRRGLNPGASFSLPVKIATHRPVDTTALIEVKATVIREPYDAHFLARFRLGSALGDGTCVATSAKVRARTHFHFR